MNKIEPKVGQWYLRRDGHVTFVAFDKRNIIQDTTDTYPILTVEADGDECWVTETGRCWNTNEDRNTDLVEHLPDCTGFDYVKPTAKELERVPVRLWKVAHNKEVYVFSKDFHPGIHYEEIKYDESGFYLEQ